jgi:hypothetical protein
MWEAHQFGGKDHPLGRQAKPVRNQFFLTNVLYYRQKYSSVLSAVPVLVSEDPAGEEARYGGPGLTWLHMVCGCKAGWMY